MVDQKLRVDSEDLVEQGFVGNRDLGNITHRIDPVPCQPPGDTVCDLPEVCDRSMAPQQLLVGFLRELCNTYPVLIGRLMLCNDIHGDLGQVHVGADSTCGSDTGLLQNLLDHHPDQVMGTAGIDGSVWCDINEHFIDGINMDILCGKELQVDRIDLG